MLHSIIKKLFDTSTTDEKLMKAAWDGNLVQVQSLLADSGANVNFKDQSGYTPLHMASRGGHLTLVQVLLAHGATVDELDEDRWTALHEASWRGHLKVVKELLMHSAAVNKSNHIGQTPLHLAAFKGYLWTFYLVVPL
ncbi:hypothetical protein AC1031_013984 [Aphanomyces cochlioides]|nr:hypothetical protein AC1031_013984 [Aphanomyces cochlioides]